jgi:hypothetical protein
MRKFNKRPSPPLDRLDDKARLAAIERAIEEAARMGLIVDSGERRWSEHIKSHQIDLMRTVRARVMGSYWDYDDRLCGCGVIPPTATATQRSTALRRQNPSGPALSDEG